MLRVRIINECHRLENGKYHRRPRQEKYSQSQEVEEENVERPLRPAQAMPQVVYISDLLDSLKPSENITKYCLQGPGAILNVYFVYYLPEPFCRHFSSQVPGDKHSQITHQKYQFA